MASQYRYNPEELPTYLKILKHKMCATASIHCQDTSNEMQI